MSEVKESIDELLEIYSHRARDLLEFHGTQLEILI
jgi:archaellum component FlaC